MKAVFDFVQGKLTYEEFEVEFVLNPEIWTWIQQLVPTDISDAACPFRALYPMQGFETNQYNVKATIMSFGYDDIYGRNVAYNLISTLVKYHYPNVICKKPPEQSNDDLLDKMGLDYLGGPEVEDIVKDTILSHRDEGKTAIKTALKEVFHISARKHPNWVQEPEWPAMGAVPMKFISQKSDGDQFVYEFQDVNTDEIRVIVQYA